jgi:hypothetical protein
MSNPYPECYCSKHWIDFTEPPEPGTEREIYCDDFVLSVYGEKMLKRKRENKLKRILNEKLF